MKRKKYAAVFMALMLTFSFGVTALAQEVDGEDAGGGVIGEIESEEVVTESSEGSDESSLDDVTTFSGSAEAEYVMQEGWLPADTPEGSGFTVEGDVLTYDDSLEIGEYSEDRTFYRLYIETGSGVSVGDMVWGESPHSMKTYLKDKDGNISLWIRDHDCESNCAAAVSFDKADPDSALVYELSPSSAGTVRKEFWLSTLLIHLDQPATLKVSVADDMTLTSDSGASVEISGGDFGGTEFVVDELTGTKGQEAEAIVVAALGEGSKAIAYDIHLEYKDNEIELVDGVSATVTLPVPEGWIAEDIVVYHVGADGTVTDMKAVPSSDGTTVSFTTTHFSTFVIAQKAQPGGGETSETDGVEGFVRRLYTEVLGRNADPSGLKDWTEVLKNGKEQGAKVAQGFIDSDEFKKRSLSDKEYITILYHTFLDREPDAGGLAAWESVLDSGLSRLHVFKGFAESMEFTDICESYGIIRGNAELTAPMDQNEGVTKFLVRCYRLCLDREADTDGLNAWCSQVLTGQNTAKEAAYGFVFSSEFKNKNLSDEEYIRVLYRVFMDREADGAGLSDWMSVLKDGQSREHVFNGFADSSEFKEICAEYGIK